MVAGLLRGLNLQSRSSALMLCVQVSKGSRKNAEGTSPARGLQDREPPEFGGCCLFWRRPYSHARTQACTHTHTHEGKHSELSLMR